jgi:hypothetical protein
MAQIAGLIIDADRQLTAAKARSDALRAHALAVLVDQAETDNAAPSWRLDGASLSLDAWAATPRPTITDEHTLVEHLRTRTIPDDEMDRLATATITVPLACLDAVLALAEDVIGPFSSLDTRLSLTPAGRAWVEARATVDETGTGVDLVDLDTGEFLDQDVPGLGQVTARPRLVLRRKGKAAEATAAAVAAREELAEITASAPPEPEEAP